MAEIETLRDLRRSQIIRAARKLVAKGGLRLLTIANLEDNLAFSRGVITYHFRNKEEIVDAVLQSAVNEINEATLSHLGTEMPIEEKVKTVLGTTIQGFLDHIEAGYILLSFWSRINADKRVAALNANLYAQYREFAAMLVREGVSQKRFRRVPADQAAAVLVAVVIGLVAQVFFEPGAIDADACVEEATKTLLARWEKR